MMPTPTFKCISLDQVDKLLATFPFTRQITSVHMHHTWRPSHRDFRGHETIVSMWRFHTQNMGWRDIAQHVTIDPEGFIWLGRNWNLPPASAAGHNGNERFGPFMFEMIGNFDKGRDPFAGAQRATALQLIALVQARFKLPSSTLLLHNALSSKSCPGSSLDYTEILADVDKRRDALRLGTDAPRDLGTNPFPGEPDADLTEALAACSRAPLDRQEPADAELSHREHGTELEEAFNEQSNRAMPRGGKLSPAMLAALRPHLVNLSMGRFSNDGQITSSAADVDAIFEQNLPDALKEAKSAGKKLQLLFYAHGGLVSESSGLRIAAKHIDWWKQNGIYPIYFVWETGLYETIGSLLLRAQQRTARGLARDLWDYTFDPLIELAVRALQGPRIWGGMKSSAEHAVAAPTTSNPTGGGARHVASKLKEFCDAHAQDIDLHAVGHSAGSIFHSHFLALTHELRVPTFASAHFLAPAIRVDTFKQMMAGRIGDGKAARNLTIFTMKEDYEKADDCARIYNKSLLYLIHYALEEARATPILGLEESLRGDPALKTLFGLGGTTSPLGEVVWSATASDTGRSASRSLTHGDFDDDAPTMDSLARRILGKADADHIVAYGSARDVTLLPREWTNEVDWPEALAVATLVPAPLPAAPPVAGTMPWTGPAVPIVPLPDGRPGAGRRRALCIGINRYPDPDHALAGCVADAQIWAATLARMGFATTLLVDQHATRDAIARDLLALVSDSRAGDVIVFQFAGHGTMVPDLNGDDDDGKDEAICPVDFASGALYIDDDIAHVFAQLPDGVNLTCFMDCCHSGTNTRFAVGAPPAIRRSDRDERKRYITATPELVDAHMRFRQRLGDGRRSVGTGGRSRMRDIKFSACLDSEVAWESDGHGEFTLRATRILAAGAEGLTNQQFMRRLTTEFGAGTRQHPMLDCAPDAAAQLLLQPLAANRGVTSTPQAGVDVALFAQTLASLQQLITQLAAR